MSDPNLQQLVGAVLFGIGIIAFGFFLIALYNRHKIRTADTAMRKNWESEVAAAPMPSYDGDTYDWPETSLARYLGMTEEPETRDDIPLVVYPVPPVPASEVSGPLPVRPFASGYDPASDAESYIRQMEADTTAFISRLAAD